VWRCKASQNPERGKFWSNCLDKAVQGMEINELGVVGVKQ